MVKTRIGQDRYLICSNASPLLKSIQWAKKVANSDIPVLLFGETGTGKDLFARLIHCNSLQRGPYLGLNMGGIQPNLADNELFGNEKGAFTGANGSKGKIEEANGGTLFLDEVNSMSLDIQAKFLNVVEEKTIRRLGSNKIINVDFRLVTATNQNLTELVNAGVFRKDLFYRIMVAQISIPPLRERKDDIPLLVQYFLEYHSLRNSKNSEIKRIAPHALKKLMDHDWPGNVRELENVIRPAIVTSENTIILPEDINIVELKEENSKYYNDTEKYISQLKKLDKIEKMLKLGKSSSEIGREFYSGKHPDKSLSNFFRTTKVINIFRENSREEIEKRWGHILLELKFKRKRVVFGCEYPEWLKKLVSPRGDLKVSNTYNCYLTK